MKPLIVLALSAVLSVTAGCATMADSSDKITGAGQITKTVDSFDGSTFVEMGPAFLYENRNDLMGVGIKLGARWNSKHPDYVAIVLAHQSSTHSDTIYLNFSGMDVKLNGEVTSFKTDGYTSHNNSGYNSVGRTIYTDSTNHLVMPVEYLKRMLSADSCMLKIYTSEGYVLADFGIERSSAGQATAKFYLPQFLANTQ